MLCSNCGKELIPGNKFCTHCGAKIEMNMEQMGSVENAGLLGSEEETDTALSVDEDETVTAFSDPEREAVTSFSSSEEETVTLIAAVGENEAYKSPQDESFPKKKEKSMPKGKKEGKLSEQKKHWKPLLAKKNKNQSSEDIDQNQRSDWSGEIQTKAEDQSGQSQQSDMQMNGPQQFQQNGIQVQQGFQNEKQFKPGGDTESNSGRAKLKYMDHVIDGSAQPSSYVQNDAVPPSEKSTGGKAKLIVLLIIFLLLLAFCGYLGFRIIQLL